MTLTGTGQALSQAHYQRRLEEVQSEARELDRQSRRLSSFRGLAFLGAAGAGAAALWSSAGTTAWVVAGAFLAGFSALIVRHALVANRRGQLETRAGVLEDGLLRVEGKARFDSDTGARFIEEQHPYTGDLDIFGHSSDGDRGVSVKKKPTTPSNRPVRTLFELLSSAETSVGARTVAEWLATAAPPDVVRARRDAAVELSEDPAFLEDLATLGRISGAGKALDEPLLKWAEAPMSPLSSTQVMAARVLVPVTWLLIACSQIPIEPEHPFAWLMSHGWWITFGLQTLVLLTLRAGTEPAIIAASSREQPFGKYRRLFELIEARKPKAELLKTVLKPLVEEREGAEVRASQDIARLDRIIGFADLRHNTIIHLLANLFLLYDLWCALALRRWKKASGHRARGWLNALGQWEALGSIARFHREHPTFVWPEVTDGAPILTGTAVGHPLIVAERRVANDFSLPEAGRGLLITGSNMSGKSTMLRAIGINTVLALSGAPVCAKSFQTSALAVRTSMRISDSLDEGVSHFYAELKRLKSVVETTEDGRPVLFLLDEILRGTNSRERHIGAKAVIHRLLRAGALGAVSSHDLGLAELETESDGKVVNVHFEEQVENGQMTFDYHLRPGVVQSANALRLMRQVGLIRVEDDS